MINTPILSKLFTRDSTNGLSYSTSSINSKLSRLSINSSILYISILSPKSLTEIRSSSGL